MKRDICFSAGSDIVENHAFTHLRDSDDEQDQKEHKNVTHL